MGYSHYWRPKKKPTPEQWQNITDGFKKLQAFCLLTNPMPIQRDEEDSSPPEVNETCIIFNGIGDAGHETFYLERYTEDSFNCCKTSRKPYDMSVMVVLLLMDHFAPGAWYITSDGGEDEWLPAVNWLNTTVLSTLILFTLPHSIN